MQIRRQLGPEPAAPHAPVSKDRYLLYASTFFRSLAVGMIAVMIAIYLKNEGFQPGQIGTVVGVGLLGATVGVAFVTVYGDRLSRRVQLVGLSLLTGIAGIVLAYFHTFPAVIVAAFFGMLNGMGRDRGPLLVLEQAILPGTTTDENRTITFAWYNVLQDVGHALGGLMVALPTLLASMNVHLRHPNADQLILLIYASLLALCVICYLCLSAAVAGPKGSYPERVSEETKRVVWKISALFAIDALGGGFLATALISLFLYERFNAPIAAIAALFFLARVANAISHLGAALLARWIGLVNTMVFTHVPSSLILATVPFAPDFTTAALLFVVRESLVEMDVPTRQSYVMAMVKPHERAFASGITHLVRVGGWAIAPFLAGLFMQKVALFVPILVGCGLKILSDILLYMSFRRLKPPEEQPPAT